MVKKYILPIAVFALFIGCSSNEDNKKSAQTQAQTSNSSSSQQKDGLANQIKVTEGEVKTDEKRDEKIDEKLKDSKNFYYSYNEQKENKFQTLAEETYTRVDAQKRTKSPYEHVKFDLLKKNLSLNFYQKCSACHDDYANGIIGPSLLKRDADFIYNSLLKYRSKDGGNILMRDLVNNMSDEELKNIAQEVADFNKEIRKMGGNEK